MTSEESVKLHNSRKPSVPFAHSSQSSIATTSSAFAKKTSFASLRAAFKSGKATDAPPVPVIDHHAYPAALKNPFSRSTSSLAQVPPPPSPGYHRPSVTISPPQFPRSSTSSGSDLKHNRGVASRSRSHAYPRSQHSRSGSVFHSSDNGSDLGHGYAFGFGPDSYAPPVPPVPNAFGGHNFREDTPPPSDYEENVVMNPRTPSDYALHAIFIRFASSAEMKIDEFLKQPLEHDPSLPDFMGPGIDSKFDNLLNSLGRIGEKHAKPVLDSIMRWRRSQNEEVSRRHLTQSPVLNRGGVRVQDAPLILNERRSLAAIYIMCRALIAVVQSLPKDALGEATGYSLEETVFDQFEKPDLKLLAQSANHRCNAELYAKLLGLLANVR